MEPKADSDSETSQQAPDSDSQHQSSSTDQSSSRNKPTRTEAARKEKVTKDKMKRAEQSELFKELGQKVGIETQTGKRNSERTNIAILRETLKRFEEQAGPSKAIEPNNQYQSQHRLDGVIVEVDAERLKMITGYSRDEVLGTQAYIYIYREHVPYVDIELRKMLVYGRGTSVYKLKTNENKWIFLRTEGAVDTTTLTFNCTNMILTEEEGQREIDAICQKYSTWIGNKKNAPTNYTQQTLPVMDTTGDDAASAQQQQQQQYYILTTTEGEPINLLCSFLIEE